MRCCALLGGTVEMSVGGWVGKCVRGRVKRRDLKGGVESEGTAIPTTTWHLPCVFAAVALLGCVEHVVVVVVVVCSGHAALSLLLLHRQGGRKEADRVRQGREMSGVDRHQVKESSEDFVYLLGTQAGAAWCPWAGGQCLL